MNIVEAKEVVKTYDSGDVRVQALRGVDLVLSRGEMVSIMGPSGCGKTTLLNCLSGLDAVDGGEVSIEGVPLSAMSDRERTDYRARRMGFVFQYYNLMPVLTAVENVELPLLVSRVGAVEARRRAFEALELVGIPQRARHLPEQLSGGEREQLGGGDDPLAAPPVDPHGEHDPCSVPARTGGRIRAIRPARPVVLRDASAGRCRWRGRARRGACAP
jgi:putative ABC transport system ATP-binding protein